MISDNSIDILCMQETEVENNLDHSSLNLKNYCLEIETNTVKSRVAVYIVNSLSYSRMRHLEGINSHIVVIDISGSNSVKRIINVYRSFNPQNNVNARTKFLYQLEIIKNTKIDECILLGDFNLKR